MAKGSSESAEWIEVMSEDAPVNIGAMLRMPFTASQRVLGIQTKLHERAATDPGRRFDDLYNLVADPAFMATAWMRVRENKGAQTAGIDKRTARAIEASAGGVEGFLEDIRDQLRSRTFRPLPVRQRRIPKANGTLRSLGIPTVADRVVQACLKLVLEPILEADFSASSYGFRPERRAQDAVEEIRFYAQRGYEWVFEGDIASSTPPGSNATPSRALPRAASCRHFWPTSRWRCSTSTSPRNGTGMALNGTGAATACAVAPRFD
jgi:RNA-directed DNA polymerase